MPILNYTTTIAATKTVGEIQTLLTKAGADQITVRNNKEREPAALIFELGGEMYILPCRADAILKTLQKDRSIPAKYRTPEQALRVAWRIILVWVEAQVAIIQVGMVDMQEVMLPYMVLDEAKQATVYDSFREQRADRLLEVKKP